MVNVGVVDRAFEVIAKQSRIVGNHAQGDGDNEVAAHGALLLKDSVPAAQTEAVEGNPSVVYFHFS
jgi:hypothetical protein